MRTDLTCLLLLTSFAHKVAFAQKRQGLHKGSGDVRLVSSQIVLGRFAKLILEAVVQLSNSEYAQRLDVFPLRI